MIIMIISYCANLYIEYNAQIYIKLSVQLCNI